MLKKIKSTIKAYLTMISYFVIGVIVGFIFLPTLPFIKKSNRPFRIWYLIDIIIATFIHNTKMRSISGWTGQHITLPRYRKAAVIINKLAEWAGDGKNHCQRVYRLERLNMHLRGNKLDD